MSSEYEVLRNAKLKRNQAKMEELGLATTTSTGGSGNKRKTLKADKAGEAAAREPESKRLFSQLSLPIHPCNQDLPLDEEEGVRKCVAESDAELQACLRAFPDFWNMMRAGHSILLQGLGSKAFLLDQFTHYASSLPNPPQDLYVIPGYCKRSLDLSKLLDSILERWGGGGSTGIASATDNRNARSLEVKLQRVLSRAKQIDRIMLWVVPSIDGDCLAEAHDVLSTLARECGNIHLIASADHVKSASILNSRYGFVCHTVHTKLPYLLETRNYTNARLTKAVRATGGDGDIAQQQQKVDEDRLVGLAALQYVLKCVPQTHVKVFHELAKHVEMRFDTLFEFCRNKLMFQNSKTRLEHIVKEFMDQNVILRRVAKDGGSDVLQVNCSAETIGQILRGA